MQKRPFLKALGSSLLLTSTSTWLHAQTKPIRVGSTLSLTGPLAGTAVMHKIAGDIFIEQLNKRGGLLGRPVEWVSRTTSPNPTLHALCTSN